MQQILERPTLGDVLGRIADALRTASPPYEVVVGGRVIERCASLGAALLVGMECGEVFVVRRTR